MGSGESGARCFPGGAGRAGRRTEWQGYRGVVEINGVLHPGFLAEVSSRTLEAVVR